MALSVRMVAVLFFHLTSVAQTTPEDYVKQGSAKYAAGDLKGAEADFDRAIEKSPMNVAAFYHRGSVKKALKDFDGALADYDRALELQPKNAGTYNNRGLVKFSKGDFEGAIEDYTHAIDLVPKFFAAYLNRGNAKLGKNDLRGAILDYDKTLEVKPGDSSALITRGFVKSLMNDPDGAVADLDAGIQAGEAKASDYIVRACVNQELGKYDEALRDYRKFCEMVPTRQEYPSLHIWLIRTRLGERFAADAELADLLDKGRGEGWHSKIGKFLLGRIPESELFAMTVQDARKERVQYCSAYYYAGMKKLLDGDKATAAEDFRKCLAMEQTAFAEHRLARAELKSLEH
jgi:tetratricopeptide (TPR) repeat protein